MSTVTSTLASASIAVSLASLSAARGAGRRGVVVLSAAMFGSLSYVLLGASVPLPSGAAVEAIAGLASRVRPSGLPWRPLKLRLVVDIVTCRAVSVSGFIGRH